MSPFASHISIRKQEDAGVGLLAYAIYLDAREGASIEQLAKDYDLPVQSIEEHLAAARLCFEHQVDHLEFPSAAFRMPCRSEHRRSAASSQEVA